MNKTIFEFSNYKTYLKYKTEELPGAWGTKVRLAEAMGCQAAYLSQVLKDKAELSLEQVLKASAFFQLDDDEKSYFMLVHQMDRAGSPELIKYFKDQVSLILEKRMVLAKRLSATEQLNEKDLAIYYSSWIYAALHMAVTIPQFQTKEDLWKIFKIKAKKINEALQFLIETGLITEGHGRFKTGKTAVRLGNDSNWIIKHHTNWRLKAIQNLENEDIHDLHYSGVMTLSEKDAVKVKDLFLENLKKQIEVIDSSKEEKMYVMNIDFFDLGK